MCRWMPILALLAAILPGAARAGESGIEIPMRLRTAAKGEWALYSLQDSYEQKQTIVDIEEKDGDKVFTIADEMLVDGQTVQRKEARFSLKVAMREQAEMLADDDSSIKLSAISERVKDKEVEVVVIEYKGEAGDTVRSFLSEAIPVTGMIRIEIDGDIMMELKDFGY